MDAFGIATEIAGMRRHPALEQLSGRLSFVQMWNATGQFGGN